MAYVVTARWTAKEGEERAVEEAIRNLAGPSREEPGLLLYQAHRDPEDPRVFFFYEQYAAREDYDAHLASEHFQRWGLGDAIPRLEGERRREFYETWDV